MTPVYLRVKISGRSHTQLRKQIDNYLLMARGFNKMKLGRKLVNHFYRTRTMSAQEGVDVVSALYAIDYAFAPNAYIKELYVTSFPDVYLHFKAYQPPTSSFYVIH